jgi:hypothetical protein
MRKTTQTFLTATVAVVTALSLLISDFRGTQVTEASSHREAPLIALDQYADATDVYAFVSPDRPNSVTLIANFIPFENPGGGPNFYRFDDNVLYQIRLDNNGDARLDLALQFRFRTVVGNGNTILYNTGPIDNLSDPDWNVKQFMDVTAQIRQGNPASPTFTAFNLGQNLPTPPVNIGPRSTPNYEANLAEPSISTINTGAGPIRVFAGQRDESFFIDVAAAFDLLGARPLNQAHVIPLPNANGVDSIAGYNVHTIAIQVPTQLLTASGALPTGPTDPNAIIGVYSTASRPGTRVLNTDGTQTNSGNCSVAIAPDANCVQVARLANPLVNELFIPMGTSPTVSENDKDLYNAQLPATDINRIDFIRGTAQRPVEPVALLNLLYPAVIDAPTSGRNDLVRVFLTGVPGATRPPVQTDPNDPSAGPGAVPSDLMRLNTAVPATAPGSQNRLGVIAGDLGGYPNGRRPFDDVVDITLRVGAGILLGNMCGNANGTGTQNCNQAPNNILGDGVNENDRAFRTTFPYLASPVSGYENPYQGRTASADTSTPGTTAATPRP